MHKDFTEQFYLGVDGGGTQCRARLQDEGGRTLGEGTGGPANIRLGLDIAWHSIESAIGAALHCAGLKDDVLCRTSAGFGLAGILTPADREAVRARTGQFAAATVASDAHTACLGAFGGKDGAIQIIGTGSSGYAIIGGTGHALGGWGFVLAERASGAALGRDTIAAALAALDGLAPASPLTDAIIARFGSAADIVAWSEKAQPKDFAAVAPLVCEFADAGDPVAAFQIRLLASDCGAYISRLVEMGAPGVCLMGGLARHVTPWLPDNVATHLREPQGDALQGTLLMARGVAVREKVPS